MPRAILLVIAMLLATGTARAASEAEIRACRSRDSEPAARLAACEAVIADDRISGRPRAIALYVRGEAAMKKRDYDGAIAAYDVPVSRRCRA